MARLGPADWAEEGVAPETAEHLRTVFDTWQRQLIEPS
jgi:hypothetical protein